MVNKKNNVPYYIVGSLATLALLASGVFAAAPYVQVQFLAPILAPIAALGLSAPLIAVCAAFSAVVIAFSAIVVNKNRTLSKKETLLVNKTEEIEAKNEVIAKQETQLVNETEKIEAQNQTLSETKAQLAEKAKEVKDKDFIISCVDKQLAEKDVVISEMKDQLAKKARKIEAKNKFIINSDIDRQQIHQKRRAKKQTSAVEEDGDMYLESLFENISAGSAPNAQEGERFYDAKIGPDAQEGERFYDAKIGPDAQKDKPFDNAKNEPDIQQAVSKQKKSNRFSTKAKTLGALSVISAIASSSVMGYLLNQVSSYISFANNSTNIGDLHNDSFSILGAGIGATDVDNLHNDGFSISEAEILAMFGFMGLAAQCFTGSIASALSFANKPINTVNDHINLQTDYKLNQTEATLEISKKKAKKGFNVDPQKHNFINGIALEESTLIHGTETVKQNISTSVYLTMKNKFFSLFNTTYNPESYTNDIAYEAASKKQADAVNEVVEEDVAAVVEENTQVGQNGSIQAKEAVVGGSTQVGPKPLANDSINIVNDRNNSASSPANPFNPQIDELNQIKAKLEAAEERGEENFGATDTKHSFCVGNGTATTVLDFIQTPCSPGNHQVPLPGLQGMTICCPSIAKSAPPSGP